jgi:hypothetical protein
VRPKFKINILSVNLIFGFVSTVAMPTR